jgi:4-amino-4-deoxy-L-arabinose transferase-like glycosyltransferase
MSKLRTFLKSPTTLFVILITFHVFFNIYWQKINTAPPTWDSAGHLTLAYIFTDKISNFFKGEVSLLGLIRTSAYYPPLVHFIGGVVLLIFGRNYEYPLLAETLFFVISIIYLYKIIRHFFPDKPYLALLTSSVYSFFPQIWEQSRQFHLDIPLCLLVLASFYHLSLSKSLTNRKHSFLFFLFFSLAQLTKWYGFVFLVVPFVYEVLIKAVSAKDFLNSKRISNLFIGIIEVLLIAIPWYIVNLKTILSNFAISSTADYGDPRIVLSYESLFHYLKLMTSHQLGVLSILVFFAGLYVMFRDRISYRRYVLWLFLFPYLVFTVIPNKDLRYVLPLAPIAAFLVSYFLTQVGNRTLVFFKTTIFCVYLFSLFLFFSLNQYPILTDNLRLFAIAAGGPYGDTWVNEPNNYSFNPDNYKVDEMVRKAQETADNTGISANHFKVLTLSDNKFYSVSDFDLVVLQNGYYNMSVITPFYQLNPFSPEQLKDYISSVSLVLVPKFPGPSGLRNIEVLNQLITYFNSTQNTDFVAIESFDLPDGNVIALYKRINLETFNNPEVSEDSLKVSASTILLLDTEKIPGETVKVVFYSTSGAESVREVTGMFGQHRLSLEGVEKFRIDLPKNRIDPRELRGWFYKDGGVFERNSEYFSDLADSGYESVYQNLSIQPKNEILNFAYTPSVTIALEEGRVKLFLMSPNEKVFVAYATSGWQWNNFWLSSENSEVILPIEGLLQVEVTQKNQLIRGFIKDWDYFICYNGNAVCFYPLLTSLN